MYSEISPNSLNSSFLKSQKSSANFLSSCKMSFFTIQTSPHKFKVVALYRNIIATIYKFFYYIPHLYEIAEPSTLVNGRDERALPAADKSVRPCLYGRQESESNECFRSRIVWFFLYLPVSFYIVIENLGTIWAPKWQKSLIL